MVGGEMVKSGEETVLSAAKQLKGPTDDDYDKPIATNRFSETHEMSTFVEKLSSESDEESQNAGLVHEIVNGENFLVHGEMTIQDEEGDPKLKSNVPRENPLLSHPSVSRPVVATVEVEEFVYETEPPVALPENKGQKQSTVMSLRKSFDNRKSKKPMQRKPDVLDLTEPLQIVNSNKQPSSTFVYSPTTYSKARALMETEPSERNLHVKPSCHFYGTKRLQDRNSFSPKQNEHPQKQRSLSCSPLGKQASSKLMKGPPNKPLYSTPVEIPASGMSTQVDTINQPTFTRPRNFSNSSVGKQPPHSSCIQQQSPLKQRRGSSLSKAVISPRTPANSSESGVLKTATCTNKSSSATVNKDRSGNLSLLDDDVFEYTPSPQATSSNSSAFEKLVKNEDRYSKFELAKMTNERHKKLHQKTSELNEKVKEMKELEKKMSRMKGSITKLSNELKDKNRILETQSTELLDLESSKSDCDIFINKLKDDLADSQKKVEEKIKELETTHSRIEHCDSLLEEQKRLHRNLNLAQNTSLQKMKDMQEDKKNTEFLHIAQIQDKDVLIKKLEQGLAQKMETVNDLIRDKRIVEDMLLKSRIDKSKAVLSFKTPAQPSQESQASPKFPIIKSEEESPAPQKLSAKKSTRKSASKKLVEVPVRKNPAKKPRRRASSRRHTIYVDCETADKCAVAPSITEKVITSTVDTSVETVDIPCFTPPLLSQMMSETVDVACITPHSPSQIMPETPLDAALQIAVTPDVSMVCETSTVSEDSDSLQIASPIKSVTPNALTPSEMKTKQDIPTTPVACSTPIPTCVSSALVTPRTRATSGTTGTARSRRSLSLSRGKGKRGRPRSRCTSEIQRTDKMTPSEADSTVESADTVVSGKRKRKALCRYSPKVPKQEEVVKEDRAPENQVEEEPETYVAMLEDSIVQVNKSPDKATGQKHDSSISDVVSCEIIDVAVKDEATVSDKGPEEVTDKQPENLNEKSDQSDLRHIYYKDFLASSIDHVKATHSEDSSDFIHGKQSANTRHIEVPSYRDLSPLMLIHEEGEQAVAFANQKESDSTANYLRMHKKCETSEVRMMKQCERLRTQLEQRNKRKKMKEPITSLPLRELYCRNTDHVIQLEKCKHPCVSVFRCPLLPMKQKDFALPWANEIKSFAYYAKPSSSKCAPDPQVTLNPCSISSFPDTPNPENPTSSQITLTFSHSEDGIVIKTDSISATADNILSPARISLVNSDDSQPMNAIKSTNIWSNIKTSITSGLDNALSKNIFSKMSDIRNPSTSGESSKEGESLSSKRDLPVSDQLSPTKVPRIERRNIWDSWCPTAKTQNAVEQSHLSPMPSSTEQSYELSESVLNSSDSVSNSIEEESSLSETFDQKSFLLDARSSTGEHLPNLRPQPLTKKLEKLSKHKRPVLVCTNSSPRPSDDSYGSSPANT